jgi:hypothetical protein
MNSQQAYVGTTTPDEQQNGILGVVFGWLAHPFNSQGSALNWVLFLGLLVIAGWFWNHILMSIIEE